MSSPTVFVDVDTQYDFMDPAGKLAVPGAQEIVPNLRRLTEFAVAHGIPILATADSHTPDDLEFDEFGQHCVTGSPGHERIAATAPGGAEAASVQDLGDQVARLLQGDLPQIVVQKGQLDPFEEPVMGRLVRDLAPARAVVYGVATEYCVRLAVLGLCRTGCPVTVLEDAVRPIDPEAGAQALDEMRAAGASVQQTEEALTALAPGREG